MEEGEKPYEEEGEGSDAGAAFGPSQWSDAEDYGAQDWSAAVAALPADPVPTVAGNEELVDTSATISSEKRGARHEVHDARGDLCRSCGGAATSGRSCLGG